MLDIVDRRRGMEQGGRRSFLKASVYPEDNDICEHTTAGNEVGRFDSTKRKERGYGIAWQAQFDQPIRPIKRDADYGRGVIFSDAKRMRRGRPNA